MPISSLSIILAELRKLSAYEVTYVAKVVENQSMAVVTVTSISDEIKEKCFTKGVICPHCSANHTVRNGKVNGKQRYLCRAVASLLMTLQTQHCQELNPAMRNGLAI